MIHFSKKLVAVTSVVAASITIIVFVTGQPDLIQIWDAFSPAVGSRGWTTVAITSGVVIAVYYWTRMRGRGIPDTFKVYPVRIANQDTLDLSWHRLTQVNDQSTRLKIFVGHDIILPAGDLKPDLNRMGWIAWFRAIYSKLGSEDFAGHRVFLLPTETNLRGNFIWIKMWKSYIVSTYIWKYHELDQFLGLDDYVLVNILNIITRQYFLFPHNPSTNRCLNDYARIQKNMIVAFQNGPLCNSCRDTLHKKTPTVLRDIYELYDLIRCYGKRRLQFERKDDALEVDGLVFRKSRHR